MIKLTSFQNTEKIPVNANYLKLLKKNGYYTYHLHFRIDRVCVLPKGCSFYRIILRTQSTFSFSHFARVSFVIRTQFVLFEAETGNGEHNNTIRDLYWFSGREQETEKLHFYKLCISYRTVCFYLITRIMASSRLSRLFVLSS